MRAAVSTITSQVKAPGVSAAAARPLAAASAATEAELGRDAAQHRLGEMSAWCPLGEYSAGFNAPLEALCLDKRPFSNLHEGHEKTIESMW